MKKKILNLSKFIFAIFLSLSSFNLFTHGGGLNSEGCHNNKKINNYHCHNVNKDTDEKIVLKNKKKLSEKIINEQWCKERNGISEFRTKDGTYVDCITDIYAVEVEFDNNWKEAIGQSLHYAESTNKKAAILLIKKTKLQNKYFEQLIRVKKKYQLPIKVFLIEID